MDGEDAHSRSRLLGAADASPIVVVNLNGRSPIVFLGDHAGRAIPAALNDLGLGAADLSRHIALDIGVAALGADLAAQMDAIFIAQHYSRLVIDCNRAVDHAGSIPEISDGSSIPGNAGIAEADRAARQNEIFWPYHARIAQELDARAARGEKIILLSLHSFTPVFGGFARPWRYGVLHRNDTPLAPRALAALRALGGEVGDNQPYAMEGIDFTIPYHADARGLPYLELEIRQDLIDDSEGRRIVAAELAAMLAGLVQA